MARKPSYCWDTTVFLAFLKGEESSKQPGMLSVIDQIESAKCSLVVPVLLYTEILVANNDAKVMAVFRNFLKRSNVTTANITLKMAEKAEAIRTRGLNEKPKRKIRTPDAIFLACGILYGVDLMHSLDGHMLKLDRSPTVEGMQVCKPKASDGAQSMF